MRFDWVLDPAGPETAAEPLAVQVSDSLRFEMVGFGADLDLKRVRGQTGQEPYHVHVSDEGNPDSWVNLVVPLDTPMRIDVPGIDGPQEIFGNTHFWHLPEERWADYHVAACTPVNTAGVSLSLHFLEEVARERPLPEPLEALLDRGRSPPFFASRRTGPALKRAVSELLNHPYHGSIGRLYAEGKSMEITALALDALRTPEPAARRGLSEWERQRVRQAQERLVLNLQDPPIVRELAHAVGLSISRLEYGFRELHGVSVFRWLQDYRLDVARELLEKEDLPIKTIAFRLGYTYPNNFTNAFRRRFGMAPGAVRHRK
ncbi:MAG TPA: AraC family transcriptional regulator [Gammaproteobacteria bacterium]|nr:AraC family transcriptional regulator [Gammaproteobacteria bacterium]